MKKPMCWFLCVLMLLVGCAGREANPIPAYLPGDNDRSCGVLVAEIAQLQADMQRMLPKTNKGTSNALWATAGVFLIVPFFFMDLKGAEKIEFDAMRARHNRLLLICADNGCDMTGVRAERIPSAKKAKAMAKEMEREAKNKKKDKDTKEETKTINRTEYSEFQQFLEWKKNNEANSKTVMVSRSLWWNSFTSETFVIETDSQGIILASYGPLTEHLKPLDTYKLTPGINAQLQRSMEK